jgi:hypothetical protein
MRPLPAPPAKVIFPAPPSCDSNRAPPLSSPLGSFQFSFRRAWPASRRAGWDVGVGPGVARWARVNRRCESCWARFPCLCRLRGRACRRMVKGRKAIEIGIHSVGTKPSGSTMPFFDGLRRQLAGVDHSNGIGAHVCHVEPAAVAVHSQRHRLRAEIALSRKPRVEVALHRKLSACATLTAATASRLASAT